MAVCSCDLVNLGFLMLAVLSITAISSCLYNIIMEASTAGAGASTAGASTAGAGSDKPAVVLFACIQNAGRSQMSTALFNMLVDPRSAIATSAGSRPADHVHPEVITVMQELGVDLSAAQPQLLTAELAGDANVLVTMGCGEACPCVPGLTMVQWQIPDPHNQAVDAVRQLRELLREQVLQLAQQQGYTLRS